MQNEIQTLIQKCKADYTKFVTASDRGTPDPDSYFGKTLANFENSFTVKEGSKYIKLIRGGGVWGFIVNTDNDKKFVKGDILKAAGYNAGSAAGKKYSPHGGGFDKKRDNDSPWNRSKTRSNSSTENFEKPIDPWANWKK